MLQRAFPEEANLRSMMEAGRFQPEDVGAWFGRAIVHKLQAELHQDGLDKPRIPAAIFSSGYYSEGQRYQPDLGLKFR